MSNLSTLFGATGMPPARAGKHPHNAFTLVELLVVISLIGLLLGLVVPSLNSILGGTSLGQGAQTVSDQITLARQIASTGDHTTEVRLIQTSGTNSGYYDALQIWVSGKAAGKMAILPQSIVISGNSNLSPIVAMLTSSSNTGTLPAGGVAPNAPYVSFSFRPSGEVVPVPGNPLTGASNYYLTVVPSRLATSGTLPSNYAIVQINPYTGTPRLYRP